MTWSIGFDTKWHRDIGYGVPAVCDHPGCGAAIDRGLSYVCGGALHGGYSGCGLFFCGPHRMPAGADRAFVELCQACARGIAPFEATADVPEWITHKLTHESWQRWRDQNPEEVQRMRAFDLSIERPA